MIIEEQIRSMTEAIDDAPVTADEIFARGSIDDAARPGARRWAMVAAAIVVVIGGLLAFVALGRDSNEPSPIVSIPERIPPSPVVPVPETGPLATTTPGDDVESGLTNEPTLEYRDDVSWWAPAALPDGWTYGYASVLDGAQSIWVVDAATGSQIEIVLGAADGASVEGVVDGTSTENLGDETWTVSEEDSTSRLTRSIGGELLEVRGPPEETRFVAGSLELVDESDLVRPPFRDDAPPGPVVHTAIDDGVSFEVRAHTDGLYTSVGGDIKRVSSDDPLAFGDYRYEVVDDATSTQVLVSGVALAGLDRVSFGLLAGDAAEAEIVASDRFTDDFFALLIDVPTEVVVGYESGDIELLTRWTIAEVGGQQRVYDEPASENCVNCGDVAPADDPPEPLEPARLATPFVDGPTNTYRNDTIWWMPAIVPDGFEYLWAQEFGAGERELHYASAAELADPAIIPDRTNGGNISVWVAQGEPVEQWQAWLDSGEREQVLVDGEIWLRNAPGGNALSGVVDDEFISVVAPTGALALEVVETLERLPETEFDRPPYWAGGGEVVARLDPDPAGDEVPLELLAWTDGVTVDVDGWGPLFPTNEPIQFIGMTTRPPSQGGATTIVAVTSPEVATVEFEQPNGELIVVEPTDLTGRFDIGFVFVEVGSPEPAPDGGPGVIGPSIPSVVARNVDGDVVAVYSEPF